MTTGIAPTTAKNQNPAVQPKRTASTPPISGDTAAPRLIDKVKNPMMLAEPSRPQASRTKARVTTLPAHAPKACNTRPTNNASIVNASAHTTLATTKSAVA